MTSEFVLEAITFTAGSVLSLTHLLLISYIAVVWARHYFKDQSLSIQLSCIAVSMYWLFGAVFAPLIILGKFDRIWTTLTISALAAIAWRLWGRKRPVCRELFATVKLTVKQIWQQLPVTIKVLFIAVWAVALIRFSRGLIAPPLAWDALTYHLLKAGRWVQSGRWIFEDAPDSWRFYEYFPPLGDVYFAWAMLGTHTDAYLALTNLAIYVTCFLSAYATARSVQFSPDNSILISTAIVSAPAILSFITASYVDNTAFSLVMLGSALCISALTTSTPKSAAAGSVAMALAVGIKITNLPYLALATLVLLVLTFREKKKMLLIAAPFILVCLSWQIYLVMIGKTPFYPAPFTILGVTVEPGQPEFIKHHYHELDFWLPYMWEMPNSVVKFMVNKERWLPDHLNFTWTFPAVILLGILGYYNLIKSRSLPHKLLLVGLFLGSAVIFATFWSPGTAFYRGIWIDSMGRFFTTFYAMLMIGFFSFSHTAITRIGYGIIAISIFYAIPKAWTALDYQAAAIGLTASAIVTGLILKKTAASKLYKPITALVLFIIPVTIHEIQAKYRYKFYNNADQVYDVMIPGIMGFPGGAAQWLDQKENVRVNFSIAYQGITNRWFRYIFLGSNLQNEVLYVTPTHDGTIWSQSIEPHKGLSDSKWHQRLMEHKVNFHVSVTPYPQEANWAISSKGMQQLLIGANTEWILFSVER